MAGCTQSHEVVYIVSASLGEWLDVVYFLSRRDPSVLLALLAEGMRRDISIPNTLPTPAVSFLHGRVTLVAFVSFCFFLGVLLAKAAVRQLGTTGVGTWSFGLKGH